MCPTGLFRGIRLGECGGTGVTVVDQEEKLRRHWNKQAPSYDRQMGFLERRFFGDTREWICRQATGDVLEIAVGTGLNLPHYADSVRLTGIEFSPAMLAIGKDRAEKLGLTADLGIGDAQALEFPDASFDTVVCTLSLCAIPDDRRAIQEMIRVLRPGGQLLLADHVAGSPWLVRALQWLIERASIPIGQEHFRRRPILHVQAAGLVVERHARFKLGVIERLAARKPPTAG
jgi:ubiquinone/menaquinone biosynthesis C-methylase UbiE